MSDHEERIADLERKLENLRVNHAELYEIVCGIQLKLDPSLGKDNAIAEGEEYD